MRGNKTCAFYEERVIDGRLHWTDIDHGWVPFTCKQLTQKVEYCKAVHGQHTLSACDTAAQQLDRTITEIKDILRDLRRLS